MPDILFGARGYGPKVYSRSDEGLSPMGYHVFGIYIYRHDRQAIMGGQVETKRLTNLNGNDGCSPSRGGGGRYEKAVKKGKVL